MKKRNFYPHYSIYSDAGFSILESMLAIGVLLVGASLITSFFSKTFQLQAYNSLILEQSMMKKSVLDSVDCELTRKNSQNYCLSEKPIQLMKSVDGEAVPLTNNLITSGNLKGSGNFIDNWFLKANCQENSIVVNYAKASEGGEFALHPLSKSPMSFT